MSYILDALRRADSERDRGEVPGLHTQPVPVNLPDADTERRPRLGIVLVIGAFLVLLSAVAWLLMERSSTEDLVAAQGPAAPAAVTAVTPPTPAAYATSTAAAAIAQTDSPPSPTAPTAAAARPSGAADADNKPVATARERTPPKAAKVTRPAADKPARPATKPAPTPSTPAKASTREAEPRPRIYALHELPEEIRRALPVTAVNGSVYSRSAASRMVVINGQVFHEGDELADQLVLEEIRQKSAVLRFKGFRYLINYP